MSEKIEIARRMILYDIKMHMIRLDITHKMIADKCGWHESTVSRILSAKYSPTLDNLLKLCEAINLKINLSPAP